MFYWQLLHDILWMIYFDTILKLWRHWYLPLNMKYLLKSAKLRLLFYLLNWLLLRLILFLNARKQDLLTLRNPYLSSSCEKTEQYLSISCVDDHLSVHGQFHWLIIMLVDSFCQWAVFCQYALQIIRYVIFLRICLGGWNPLSTDSCLTSTVFMS